MNPPDFSDLTPPPELVDQCDELSRGGAVLVAYRAGAQHGWNEARQLWPEPIRDRPPTEADGDGFEDVQILTNGDRWKVCHWAEVAGSGHRWLHCPGWRPPAPKVPTREEALAIIERKRASSWHFSVDEMSVINWRLGGRGGGRMKWLRNLAKWAWIFAGGFLAALNVSKLVYTNPNYEARWLNVALAVSFAAIAPFYWSEK